MKKNINVLMGGPSEEHEVSLHSGLEAVRHIDTISYRVSAVVITREKRFFHARSVDQLSMDDLQDPAGSSLFKGPYAPSAAAPVWEDCDAAFLALHGSFGEDGIIQGYLESISVPYTGSNVYASAVAMNKITSKTLFRQGGLTVAPHTLFGSDHPETTVDGVIAAHGLPCFVKCPQSGSSKLLGRAGTREELAAMLEEFSRFATEIIVEPLISGPEFTCGVLENDAGMPFALPPIEIRPKSSFFDYTAKYTAGASDELVPAPQPPSLLQRIGETALSAHHIIGCSGISRTDMILFDNQFYVLEINTLPGLTANSLIPKAYAATGGTFSALLDLLIRQALSRGGAPTP